CRIADRDISADRPCAENGRSSNRTSRRKFRTIVARISCGGGDGLCVSRRERKSGRKGSNPIAECRNVSRADKCLALDKTGRISAVAEVKFNAENGVRQT